MSIKAIFPSGVTELTVNGLHQWDYGQKLVVEATDLPALVEIHFACLGMQSAVVRTCSAVSGVLEAAIPDLCLEQTAPIIAWVYAIDGTEGATVKTITLPIIARTRPQTEASIPRDNSDAYTQFLTEVNSAVKSLSEGDVLIQRALTADTAESATSAATAAYADEAGTARSAVTAEVAAGAGEANTAGFATQAGFADEARWAESSTKAHGVEIINTINPETHQITQTGLYMVEYRDRLESGEEVGYTDIIYIPYLNIKTAVSTPGYRPLESTYEQVGIQYSGDTQTFGIMNGSADAYITNIWLLATEYVGG